MHGTVQTSCNSRRRARRPQDVVCIKANGRMQVFSAGQVGQTHAAAYSRRKEVNYEIRVISTNGKSGKCPYYTANRLRFQEKSELFEIFVNYDKVLCQWYYVKLATQSCPKIELFRSLYHIWWRLRRGGSKYGL